MKNKKLAKHKKLARHKNPATRVYHIPDPQPVFREDSGPCIIRLTNRHTQETMYLGAVHLGSEHAGVRDYQDYENRSFPSAEEAAKHPYPSEVQAYYGGVLSLPKTENIDYEIVALNPTKPADAPVPN
jgi:hypothetical protein